MKGNSVNFFIIGFCLITYAFGKTVYVGPAGVGTDSVGCGNTTANACSLLGVAFDPTKGGVVHGDTVELLAGVYDDSNSPGALDLGLYGQDNVTLVGQGVGVSIIDLNFEHHLVLDGRNGWVIANVTILGGVNDDSQPLSSGDGGCMEIIDSSVTLENVAFSSCNATGNGGGVYISSSVPAQVHLRQLSVHSSQAMDGGGAYLALHNGPESALSIVGYHASGCLALNNGGGLYVADAQASSSSGALVMMVDITALSCYAGVDAGGLDIRDRRATVQGLLVKSCSSGVRNAGLRYVPATLEDAWLENNESPSVGGAAIVSNSYESVRVIRNVTITHNRATDGHGSGLFLDPSMSVTLFDTLIEYNFASSNGALYTNSNVKLGAGTIIRYNTCRGTGNNGAGIRVTTSGSIDLAYARDSGAQVYGNNQMGGSASIDNIDCHPSSATHPYVCGSCSYGGQCDFDTTEAEVTGCRCHPGVKDAPGGLARCNSCASPGMGFSHDTRSCEVCDIGTYSRATPQGLEECAPCPMGSYGLNVGGESLSACTPCPPNTYFNASTAGASSPDVCVPCPSGLSSKEGSLSCDSGDASGDITNAVDAINGDLAALENSIDGRIADLESDIAGVLAAINTFTPPDAIEGGVRIGVKVYCDAEYQHNSSGDGCERIPPPELTSSTATAVSLALAGLAAVAIGLVLYQRPRGELVRSEASI